MMDREELVALGAKALSEAAEREHVTIETPPFFVRAVLDAVLPAIEDQNTQIRMERDWAVAELSDERLGHEGMCA